MKELRPWGYFDVLIQTKRFKAKKLVVNPGQELSLQWHRFRDELWIVFSGNGAVIINDRTSHAQAGSVFFISAETNHKIINDREEPLVIFEIQTGPLLDEDDIVRISDKYGRI